MVIHFVSWFACFDGMRHHTQPDGDGFAPVVVGFAE